MFWGRGGDIMDVMGVRNGLLVGRSGGWGLVCGEL